MASLESFQILLEQMRSDFLNELPERCDSLDELILGFEKSPEDETLFNELFRQIHSLKGSGGTHGLTIITTLCHQFENFLVFSKSNNIFDQVYASQALAYTDLLRQVASIAISQKSTEFANIEAEIHRLMSFHNQEKKLGLIVEGSSMMASLYLQALNQLSVQLMINSSGLEALANLIREPFDFIILGRELRDLNGVALLAALRHSESQNQNIPVIFVSSKKQSDLDQFSISKTILKDQALASNLVSAIKEILS
ncbi:Hpt domain-containing protein [Aliikangiella sp. IMCC44359]|uniref:Hpt domain-containing protein n=1 Tax=Aliikangiella sp. IMCC44359 TaxID=3459125 RepID=UPI00403AC795